MQLEATANPTPTPRAEQVPDSVQARTNQGLVRVGIDIGGTFTDFVIIHPASGKLDTFKLLSTPASPEMAVLEGLQRIFSMFKSESPGSYAIIHGSTVATNALLERKGARTALVTTQGFRDILKIGRQDRQQLYNLRVSAPDPLIPDELRFEVSERVNHQGMILIPLDSAQLDKVVAQIHAHGVESVAICLLFSFLDNSHERSIAQNLRGSGLFVSASHEVLPEYREYERTSTTAVNAYVSPVLDRYITKLENNLQLMHKKAALKLRVMQSNGGIIGLDEARLNGVRCVLSGPAGGVIGAQFTALRASQSPDKENSDLQILTLDMGGTSTDVSLIAGRPQVTSDLTVAGCPIHIPVLDIHTIGAGGGSIARIDPGGVLRVGPESAGAAPGPACYARVSLQDSLPTVSDANLVLGRLVPDNFLGGLMPLDLERARFVMHRLGLQLGLTPEQVALGIVEIVNAHMERALRVISVERGYDPQGFTLLSFGGAGGLHAIELALRLNIPTVLVPPMASTLSAFGMLAADVVKDYTLTVMLPGDTHEDQIAAALDPINQRGLTEMGAEGVPPEDILIENFLDMRYRGQSYELTVPYTPGDQPAFHQAHQRAYGYHRADAAVEIVNLRVRATGIQSPPALHASPEGDPDPTPALQGFHQVIYDHGPENTPTFQGELLQPGNVVLGPALIIRTDTTILVGGEDVCRVDSYGNLLISISAARNV